MFKSELAVVVCVSEVDVIVGDGRVVAFAENDDTRLVDFVEESVDKGDKSVEKVCRMTEESNV